MTLKELNFKELIGIDSDSVNSYDFDEYIKNNCTHRITSYCTLCEEKNIKVCEDANFSLLNISHGSTSDDFLKAFDIYPDITNWNNDAVLFVMESPSIDYGFYKEIEFKKNGITYKKHPTSQWYWIHVKQKIAEYGYPKQFQGGKYGPFVASAILTFKLSNAYLTNLVKCGLNDQNNNYKGIGDYNPECIKTCANKFLKNEIELIQPKVIFTFGSKVFDWVKYLVNDEWNKNITVVGLPHPAGQRRGFKNVYYNTLYFCLIAKWLYKTNVINEQFYIELMKEYANEM